MTHDLAFWRTQELRLAKLYESSKDDPILGPQLSDRLQDAQTHLSECQRQPGSLLPREATHTPRVALFMRGTSVEGSRGIRPSLAGEALIQYERMFEAQALHDERIAAQRLGRQRRLRGSPKPELLFIGTPRGSFGLEFVPRLTDAADAAESQGHSLHRVAEVIAALSQDSDDLVTMSQSIPPRVLQGVKKFFSVLAQHNTELRIAFDDKESIVISSNQIERAASRLETEWNEETASESGVFRGLTRETLQFDFKADAGEIISGELDESLTEDDFDRIDTLTNRQCTAYLQKTEVRQVSGAQRTTWVLLNVVPHGPAEEFPPRSKPD